jgi:hypothetical protein
LLGSVNYWNLRLEPYADATVYIENLIDFTRLYYNKFAIDLEEVRANIFLELRMYFDSSVCVGVGYSIDNVLFKLEMA